MNWVDVAIVLIVASSAFFSLRIGFLRQALAVVGVVVGIYSSLSHYEALAEKLGPHIGPAALANLVAFVLILISVWVAFAALASMARGALKAFGLAWTDHFFGMLVGLLAGLFFTVCFLLLFVRISAFGVSDAIGQSVVGSLIFRVLPHLEKLLPGDVRIFVRI